jgi:hypothetical protein
MSSSPPPSIGNARHGTTFNAETAELAEQNRFLCGFRMFCVDRRGSQLDRQGSHNALHGFEKSMSTVSGLAVTVTIEWRSSPLDALTTSS